MTLTEIKTVTDSVLEKLLLGQGSWRRSSAYVDYVSLEFACFGDDDEVVATIREEFTAFAKEHGWKAYVSRVKNSVTVALQASNVISSSNKRMAA